MKQRISYYTMFAAAVLLCAAACSKEDTDNNPAIPDEPAGGNTGVNVQFTAGLGAETRTSHESDGKTPEGFIVKWKGYNDNQTTYDKVGILVENPTTQTSVAGAKNVPYRPTTSAASSPLEADGTPLSGLEVGKTYNFYSYYPYDNNQSIHFGCVIVPNLKEQTQAAPGDNTHFETYDFLIAQQKGVTIEASSNPPTVDFQYKHLFTSLQFKLKNGRSAAVQINKITLERQDGNKMKIPTYYSFQVGRVGSTTYFDFQQLTVTSPTDLSANSTQKFWMMLYPASIEDATELKLSVYLSDNNGNYLYTLKKAVPKGGFEAGYNYTVEMDVKDTGLSTDESWANAISNKEELKAFRNKVNNGTPYTGQTFRLTDHIDLTGETWEPIGKTNDKSFKGTFDGGGYHISGLNVNMTENGAGLFGGVDNGAIRNLRVSGNVTSTGKIYVGGIVGYSKNTTVEHCIFSGDVNGSQHVGGIAGAGATITGCYTKGNVTGVQFVGGIVGTGNAIDCYSEAVVTNGTNIGGIAGQNSGTVTRCYATGAVSAKLGGGGIVGNNYNKTVTDCIALTPKITRTEGTETGFGRIASSGTFTNCAAYSRMTLPDGITATDNANGKDGASLSKEQCLTKDTYTSRGFTTDNGWAFDAGTWRYLPWNKAFESFPGITANDYRIAVPQHLK